MNKLKIERTNSSDKNFQLLTNELDQYLAAINGDKNEFFVQYNQASLIKHVVILYNNDLPIGCGAIKPYSAEVMEIKRMYVTPDSRGKGSASTILQELESWARELGATSCILETDKTMLPAVALYQKHLYQIIPNYDQYKDSSSSICFAKKLL